HQADTTDLRRVNIAHLGRSCVGVDTTRSERGDTAAVREFRQRILLVEILNQRIAGEEFADGSHEGTGVNEIIRAADFVFFVQFQSGANGTSHLGQGRTDGAGHDAADTTKVTVFQTVDVVRFSHAQRQTEE